MSKDLSLYDGVMNKMRELLDQCYTLEKRCIGDVGDFTRWVQDSNEWFESKAKQVETQALRIYPSGITKDFDEDEQEVVLATLPE